MTSASNCKKTRKIFCGSGGEICVHFSNNFFFYPRIFSQILSVRFLFQFFGTRFGFSLSETMSQQRPPAYLQQGPNGNPTTPFAFTDHPVPPYLLQRSPVAASVQIPWSHSAYTRPQSSPIVSVPGKVSFFSYFSLILKKILVANFFLFCQRSLCELQLKVQKELGLIW